MLRFARGLLPYWRAAHWPSKRWAWIIGILLQRFVVSTDPIVVRTPIDVWGERWPRSFSGHSITR
jgi:hypothetical protein